MSAVWFARLSRRGVGGPRMTPVSREGWLVVAAFVGAMFAGGLAMFFLMLADHVVIGICAFAVLAIAGASFLFWASIAHGDTSRTAADYRQMRQGGTT